MFIFKSISNNYNFTFFCLAAPTFVTKPQDKKVGLNGLATFDCVAQGNPEPSIFWNKEGSQVLMFPGNSYGHLHVTNEGSLHIQGALRDDAGFLICSAFSVAGSSTARAFLQVNLTLWDMSMSVLVFSFVKLFSFYISVVYSIRCFRI